MALNIAEAIKTVVQELVLTKTQVSPTSLVYEEKAGGFQCGTCRFARRGDRPDGKGLCVIKTGEIDVNDGCCAAWMADERQLKAVSH